MLCLILLNYPSVAYSDKARVNISITYQQSTGFIQRLIQQMQLDLSSQGFQASSVKINPESPVPEELNTSDIVIAVGSKTTKQLLDAELHSPILSVLMPRHLADALQESHPRQKQWSSLLIDQPLERHFHLVTSIFGAHQQAGILLGPYTDNMKPLLERAAKRAQHNIITEQVKDTEQIMASLQTLNKKSNVLITLPDPMVFNQNTIRGILLSSYRNKLPIIGFSRAYVKAGAIAAIYSEPTQISQQMASIINEFILQKSFSKNHYYPTDFSVALNTNVANSLGIDLESSASIIRRIKKAEQ